MDFKQLNKNNFLMYAMKIYSNPQCESMEEFHEDLNRIKYIKRLLGRYETKGHLRERLVLNHLIILYNVFGAEGCSRILFFKIGKEFHPHLKSFLIYLNHLPYTIPEVDLSRIPPDHRITKILESIQ
tara:strand:+ start:8366 stop:8746 length:381 start_codon:yes stop_codon:yes gene_type:complete